MAEPLAIKIKTLTPLWTGGIDGKSDRLHVTGIMGSLRWWYEALVRGMGGEVCDPTEHACLYNADKPDKGLCLACQVFGATGWARRFRLVIQDTTQPDGPTGARQPTGNRFKRNSTSERPSWYFNNGPGRGGTITLFVIPLSSDFDPHVILGLLKLIERHAGLAAKTQLGYGWVQLEQPPILDATAFVQAIQAAAVTRPSASNGLPTLGEMFFAQVKTNAPALTAMLNLKYDVRATFRSAFGGDQTLRHFVCGAVQGNHRQASKVFFSQAIGGMVRVWGWIPPLPNEISGRLPGVTRDQVIDQVKATMSKFGTLQSWREYNSSRDTVSPSQTDSDTFLTSLLREEGE